MSDNERIKLLEKQVALLEKIVELQKQVAPVAVPYYPSYPGPCWNPIITCGK